MADTTQPDNTEKNPDDWATGDERATGAQMSYLKTMADEAGQDIPDELTKADASKLIEKLQEKTNRSGDS